MGKKIPRLLYFFPDSWDDSLISKPLTENPNKGQNKMATKNNEKAVQDTNNSAKVEIAKVDSTIVDKYNDLSGSVHDAELFFIIEMAGELNSGRTTVRVLSASIKVAQENGNAPTIRASHAQYFQTASKLVSTIENASAQKVSEILKLAARVQRERGVEGVDSALDSATSFEQLDEQTPTQTQAKEDKKVEIKVPDSVEIIVAETIARLGALKNLKDATTADLQALKSVMSALHVIAKNTEKKSA